MRRKSLLVLATLFVLSACNEQIASDLDTSSLNNQNGSTTTTTPLGRGDTNSDPLSGYDKVSFSKYIYKKKEEKVFLIDFNFFPQGTDFQKDKAVFPCETQDLPEGVSASVNAPVDTTKCDDQVVVDLKTAKMTFLGLEIAYEETVNLFDAQFEFKISEAGFIDSTDNQAVSIESDDANLENVYDTVMNKRLQ